MVGPLIGHFCFPAGVIWPLEGLPRHFGWVSDLMPIKYAVLSVKAVVSKGEHISVFSAYPLANKVFLIYSLGLGIDEEQVYFGILITMAWLTFYLCLAVVFFRR